MGGLKSADNFSLLGFATLFLILPVLIVLGMALFGFRPTQGMVLIGVGVFTFLVICSAVAGLVYSVRARRG